MIIRVNAVATAIFAVTALAAAIVFTSTFQWIAAIVAMTCFLAGIAAFVWSFWVAVQRSRTENVAVVQLYLLAAGVAPDPVRRAMWLLLAAQIAIGLGTALARPNNTDGSPGTSLALGVLVPILGFGLNGLWAARYGSYSKRTADESRRSVNETDASIGQNEEHG